MKLINNYGKPLVLDGGTVLAAAGTNGSTREVESITDRDRKRLRGRVAIIEPPKPNAEPETSNPEPRSRPSRRLVSNG